jgi:Transferase family
MATVQVLSRPFKWSKANNKSAAEPVHSRVVPLPAMDQWRPIDQIRVLAFFVVRQTLDTKLLQSSLNKLIRNHLPILSARIRPTGKDGILQYHVPETIPEDYTLFEWSAATVRSDISASLGSLSTAKSDGPIILGPQIPDLERQWTPSDWPVTRRQERPDCPLLLVHVTHYSKDATVIAMNLPHAVGDMMGYASLVRAWLQVAAGEEPMPFLELEPNRLDGPQDLPPADLRKKGQYRLMSKKERIQLISGFVPELMAHPKEARHTIFFPFFTIEGLRKRCNESLKAKHGLETPLLSNADILSSLLVKVH